jgi:hypothetical protein
LELIIIDGWQNAKSFTALNMPETNAASIAMLQTSLLPLLRDSKTKICLW